MGFLRLVVRNSIRTPLRTIMTVLTVAVMLSGFIFPRTLIEAQLENIRQTPNNRVVVRSRHGWSSYLPKRYVERIREMDGVRYATGMMWTGFRIPGKDDLFFGSSAIEAEPFVQMHTELQEREGSLQAFLDDERGAIVSVELAREMGWKVGDRLKFESRMHPGTWDVNVSCIVESIREGFGQRALWVDYRHFDRALVEDQRGRMGLIAAEVFEPNEGGRIAKAIDLELGAGPVPTISMEDQVMAAANLSNFSAILTSFDFVSNLFLIVIAAVLANTMVMSVRERTRELGVMRALGFTPKTLAGLVVAEALLLGLLGGGVGLLLSYPSIEGLVSKVLADQMRFPPILIHPRVAALAFGLSVVLALAASGLPAFRVSKLRVVEALGRGK